MKGMFLTEVFPGINVWWARRKCLFTEKPTTPLGEPEASHLMPNIKRIEAIGVLFLVETMKMAILIPNFYSSHYSVARITPLQGFSEV